LFRGVVLALLIVLGPGLATDAHAQPTDPPRAELAIVTTEGNIVRVDLATATESPVTTDANTTERRYTWPTWSTDGRLAFFGFSTQPTDAYTLGIFVQGADGTVRRVLSSNEDIFTYAYWSPADCNAGPDCRDLAVLYTAANRELATVNIRDADEFSITQLSIGGPHYWDWSPDGQQLFQSRFGRELSVYDAERGEVTTQFDRTPGFGRAVDWSPVDDRLLAPIQAPGGTALAILNGEDVTLIDSGFPAGVSAAWSPNAERIAYLNEFNGGLNLIGIDGSSVEDDPTRLAEEVIAFWWSPDGRQLAYLRVEAVEAFDGPIAGRLQQQASQLVWYVYDLAKDSTRRGPGWLPTENMVYYLSFFDQFARSHRLWSADGRYLTYAETVLPDGDEWVRVVDTQATTLQAETVRAGSIGIFAWE